MHSEIVNYREEGLGVILFCFLTILCTFQNLIFLHYNFAGRFDVLIRKLQCKACAFIIQSLDLETVLKNGYWPGSTINIGCIYDIELLEFWYLQHVYQPKCSESSFLKVLSQLSSQNARVSNMLYCDGL